MKRLLRVSEREPRGNREKSELTGKSPVIVRRVVKAREDHARGVAPALPSSTARTAPLDPPPTSEKYEPHGGLAANDRYDPPPERQKGGLARFFSSLKCW